MKLYSKYCMVFLILLLSGSMYSQNVNDALRVGLPGLGSNARALGMGNSYISLSDDASAVFFNPAGFGLLKRMEFSGGLDYTSFGNDAVFFGATSEFSNSSTNLNRISFAFPFPTLRGSLVFGLSYHQTKDLTGGLKFEGFNNGNNSLIQNLNESGNVPFDLYLTDENYNTPINGMLNQSGDISEKGSLNNWTFSGAVEVAPKVYVGGNLNIITGSYESDNDYYEDDTGNNYQGVTAAGEPQTTDFQTFYLNRIINWDISGWDAKIGILYQLNQYSRFGATIQFPKFYNINEEFLVDGRSEFGSGQVYNLDGEAYSDKVEYSIKTPFEFAAGFSASYEGLIVSAEGTLSDYSQLEFDSGEGLDENYISDQNKNIRDLLGPVFRYNVGLEYAIPLIGIRIRGGFFVHPSPYKDDPSEFDRKYLTGGIGLLTDQTLGLDLAYAHGWWDTFGDNYGTNLSRTTQTISSDKIMMTATYRF